MRCLLVCVSVLTGRLEWIAVAVAPYPLYVVALIHENSLLAGRLSFGIAGTFALVVTLIRALRASQDEEQSSPNRHPIRDLRANALLHRAIALNDGERLAQTSTKGAFNA